MTWCENLKLLGAKRAGRERGRKAAGPATAFDILPNIIIPEPARIDGKSRSSLCPSIRDPNGRSEARGRERLSHTMVSLQPTAVGAWILSGKTHAPLLQGRFDCVR